MQQRQTDGWRRGVGGTRSSQPTRGPAARTRKAQAGGYGPRQLPAQDQVAPVGCTVMLPPDGSHPLDRSALRESIPPEVPIGGGSAA